MCGGVDGRGRCLGERARPGIDRRRCGRHRLRDGLGFGRQERTNDVVVADHQRAGGATRVLRPLRRRSAGHAARLRRALRPVYTEGQGKRVWLKGGADLRVIVRGPAYDSRGRATYNPRSKLNAVDVTGFRTFRQIAFAGSFEGQSTFGVGTRARLPMRVFIIKTTGGSRLVVDVAHTW